jgi:YbbR domain-containing protein
LRIGGDSVPLRKRIAPALFSLAAAIVLWLIVRSLDRQPAHFTVPITYEFPVKQVVLTERTNEVEVYVRATKAKLRQLRAAEFVVRVSNLEGRAGRDLVVLAANDVQAPFGVEVERVQPNQFWVRWERRGEKRLPVRPDVAGKPAPGFMLVSDRVAVRPSDVLVSGPEERFEERMVVKTQRLDVADRDTSLNARGVVLMPPAEGFTIEGPATADVEVPILPVVMRRTFEDVPIAVLDGGHRVSAPNPKRLRVTVEGPERILPALSPRDLRATVDAQDLPPRDEDHVVEVDVVVDQQACPGCRVVSKAPAKVNVSVSPARRGRS